MRTSIREERNRESIRTDHSSRACPPVHAEGKIDALGGRGGVHLPADDRAGVLVAVAVLGGGDFGRGAAIANAASVGRADFFRGGVEYVRDVGAANEAHGRGQEVVESGPLLQHESRRQNAAGRTVQRGAEVSVLGVFLERCGVACEWRRSMVPGTHPMESSLLEIHFRYRSPRGGALHDWLVPDPHLYGRVCRARSIWLGHSRRCFDRFCQALSPRLVQRDRRRFVHAAQMTTTQTGGTEYDARMRRAERLAAPLYFATEFLEFYKHIAAFQKKLRAKIAESSGAKSCGAPGTEFRSPLDLTVLLPHFRGFLSTIEQHAPPALGKSASQMSLLPSDSWVASLEAYWELAGKYDQKAGALAQFLARAFLQPYAESRAALTPRAPAVMTVRVCPQCCARPLLGVLRPEGDGGKRFLLCSFCSQEWEFRRILCPTCGEEAEGKLPVYVAEQLPHIRVEACDTCRFYLRTVDLTKDGRAVPLVDDLAAIPLTLWAHEKGYSRLQPNLLGT